MAVLSMLMMHEDGLHDRRGDRQACLANTVALLSQNENEHIASRSEQLRQPCRQVVRDRLVVPSLQVA